MDVEKNVTDNQPNKKPKKLAIRPKRTIFIVFAVLASVLIVSLLVSVVWYQQNLQPLKPGSSQKILFEVEKGDGTTAIADSLEEAGIIRSSTAMVLYLKLSSQPVNLQAGTYAISPGLSIAEVAELIESGKTTALKVTILPGLTLKEIKKSLLKYGYTNGDIDAALKADYDSPLLADKPNDADLEGYIFPETFEMHADDDVKKLFERSFDTLYARLQKDGLIAKYKAHGLNIHEALTLASIIQQEASAAEDQPQIAQVFLKRLKEGTKLESDVTFHYGAEKLGVKPNVSLQSPYNTRLVGGLPPTPISNMNYSALHAIAYPAPGDYLFFIAGDDLNIYYAKTLEQHQNNIDKYCHKLCGNAF